MQPLHEAEALQFLSVLHSRLQKVAAERERLLSRLKAVQQAEDDEFEDELYSYIQMHALAEESKQTSNVTRQYEDTLMRNLTLQTTLMEQLVAERKAAETRGPLLAKGGAAGGAGAARGTGDLDDLSPQQQQKRSEALDALRRVTRGAGAAAALSGAPLPAGGGAGNVPSLPIGGGPGGGGTAAGAAGVGPLSDLLTAVPSGAPLSAQELAALVKSLSTDEDVEERAAPGDAATGRTNGGLSTPGPQDDAARAEFSRLAGLQYLRVPRSNRRAWFRIAGVAVLYALVMLHRSHERARIRSELFGEMARHLQQYSTVTTQWLRRVCRPPLQSLLSDETLDFTLRSVGRIFKRRPTEEEAQERMMKLKVRVRAVLGALMDSSTVSAGMPASLLLFLKRLVSDKVLLPPDYYFEHERQALEFSRTGATKNMTPARGRMLIVNFVVSRVLLRLLLQPDLSQARVAPEQLRANLRVLATVVLRIARMALAADLLGEPPIDPSLQSQVASDTEMEPIYAYLIALMRDLAAQLAAWSQRMLAAAMDASATGAAAPAQPSAAAPVAATGAPPFASAGAEQ